ncbi:hypothetical protein ACWDBD_17310 [Streptomyces sp. NPDC001118]
MPKTWNPGDSKKFARQLTLGKSYYIVYKIAQKLAPYEDAKLYSEFVFTKTLPFTGNPCTEFGYSAATLCRLYGPVYEQPPRGVRNIADAPPQVAGPLLKGLDEAFLDEAELRGLEKQVADSSDPRTRRRLGSWRV